MIAETTKLQWIATQVPAMLPLVKNRRIIKIAVSPRAKEIVENIAEREDMKEQGVASRIYEWFGDQPLEIQKAVLGHYPPALVGDIVALILGKIVANTKATPGGKLVWDDKVVENEGEAPEAKPPTPTRGSESDEKEPKARPAGRGRGR